MRVLLYNVGRNLNRAYRTCHAFGVTELYLIRPQSQWRLSGGLFSAKDQVRVHIMDDFPDIAHTLALENYYDTKLALMDWQHIDSVLIGGETGGLPRQVVPGYRAKIPTSGGICLTVEAALAVALYSWSNYADCS